MTDSPEESESSSTAESSRSSEADALIEKLKAHLAAAEQAKDEIKSAQASTQDVVQSLGVLRDEVTALVAQAKSDLSALSNAVTSSSADNQQSYESGKDGIETINQSLQTLTADITQKTQAIENTLAETRKRVEDIVTEAAQKLESSIAASNSSAQSAESHNALANSSASSAEQSLNRVKETEQTVATLKAEVEAHHVVTREASTAKQKFDDASSKLVARFEEVCDAAQKRNEAFVTQASKFEEEIERLTGHANAMVFGATTAGIASSFDKEVKLLDARVRNATWGFMVGVALLAASLTPLIFHVLQATPGQELGVGTILARSIFLIPSGWFTLHFARRIHANFELRQQYVHKFSLAATLEPFRKAAGERGDQAVADAWEQLVKNPANVMRRHQRLGDGPAEMAGDLLSQTRKLLPSAKVSADVNPG